MNKSMKKPLLIVTIIFGALILGIATFLILQAIVPHSQTQAPVDSSPSKSKQARTEIDLADENYNSDPKKALEHYKAAKKLFEDADDKEGLDEINRRITALERDMNFTPPKDIEYAEDEPYTVEFDQSAIR